jgi:hypothetical protein
MFGPGNSVSVDKDVDGSVSGRAECDDGNSIHTAIAAVRIKHSERM